MLVVLHNPSSVAHLRDLQSRLEGQLSLRPRLVGLPVQDRAVIEDLVEVVRAVDQGALRTRDAEDAFARHGIPGFDFGRWMAEMLDEGAYLEAGID